MLNGVSVLPLTCCEDLVSSFLSESVPWEGMGGLEILPLEPAACQSSRVHCEDSENMENNDLDMYSLEKTHMKVECPCGWACVLTEMAWGPCESTQLKLSLFTDTLVCQAQF